MNLTLLTDYLGRRVGLTAERRQHILRHPDMVEWTDKLGDVLAHPEWVFREVMFDQKEGYFRETAYDQVMEKVDKDGSIIGFHVLRVSRLTRPLDVELIATDGAQ
jgi:hypothetical protein